MIRKILLASTAGLAGAMIFAAPAAAQSVCEVNGTSTGGGASATGTDTLACGPGANASGSYSIAIGGSAGFPTTATGQGIAIGADTNATGTFSIAIGQNTDATVANAVAIGTNAIADDANSVALGNGTTTTAASQVAVGGRTIGQVANGAVTATSTDAVTGQQLFATNTAVTGNTTAITALQAESAYFAVNSVGAPATATGTDAIAIGQAANANGTNSIAIGNGASNATFANSIALGAGTANTAANQVAVGGLTAATARVVSGVAAGTISSTSFQAINGSQLNASNNRITALEAMATDFTTDIADLNDRVDSVYKRGKAGTAVAIAMSGNGFLPDKKINVTGNLGFYSGAYAAALQVGAILTDSVAFNAGVAKGLNDGGKMGARMGFTLGW